MLTNDMRLVKAAQNGDPNAFTNLVRKNSQAIYLMALRLVHDPEDAREVVQDSFFKAYLHLRQFQGEARFSTWLGRITLNEALMRIRRQPERAQVSLDDRVSISDEQPLASRLEDAQPDPENSYQRAEFRRTLHRAIYRLAPPYRKVFILRHVQDFSTRETAEILGLSVMAVKTRLRRARVELRRRLLGFHESGYRDSLAKRGGRRCKPRSAAFQSKTRSSGRELAA